MRKMMISVISVSQCRISGRCEKSYLSCDRREEKKDPGDWYTGKKKGKESWQISLDEKDLATETAYEVKAYAEKGKKDRIYLGKTAFLIQEAEDASAKDEKEKPSKTCRHPVRILFWMTPPITRWAIIPSWEALR